MNMSEHDVIEFAYSIISWLEETTGMKVNEMAFPEIKDVGNRIELYVASEVPGMTVGAAYSPAVNMLIYNGSSSTQFPDHDTYIKSVIAHEMTHWLQGANGKLDGNDHRASELEAYQTQAKWLMSQKVNPEDYGLTWAKVLKASGIEHPLAYQIPSDAIDV